MNPTATAGRVTIDRLPDAPRDAEGRIELDELVDRLGRERTIVLESRPGTPHAIPWSVLALRSGTALSDDGQGTSWHGRGGVEELGPDPFTAIEDACDRLGLDPHQRGDPAAPPFTGGLAGAMSYDLARRVERLPQRAFRDRDVPALHLDVVTTAVAVDHRTEEAWIVRRPVSGIPSLALDEVVDALRERATASDGRPTSGTAITSTFDRSGYVDAIGAVLARIAAGDVFQVNLSQRLTGRFRGDVHDLYRRLRAESPAPHGAVVPAVGIASISPETFLEAETGRVTMRPMKGTRPRQEEHPQVGEELATSAKDRAENVMVVDMQRNDLGRVCEPGSVTVPELCALEAHPTVWQLVSTVEGRLRADVGWGELLRATFPCGSITGAPKVAAMQLIEELEPVRRGWYCGAIGWIGSGAARLSVAIRTALLTGTLVDYGAGGGVVADSDPDDEYDETLAKATAFLRAVGGRMAAT